MVNSQTKRAAMMLAAKKSLMLNVIKAPRNARTALMETQVATPLPSAPLPAESLTQNAIQAQAHAQSATQQMTKTAPKPRMHVTKNAGHNHSLNATTQQESAKHVRRVDQVVSQMLHAKTHAEKDHNLPCSGNAAGIQLNQNVFKIKMVP